MQGASGISTSFVPGNSGRLNLRVEFERRHLGGDRPGDWRERQDRRPLPGRQAGGSSEPAL
jgi:hypothetical protein